MTVCARRPPPNFVDIISFMHSDDPIGLQSKSGPTLNKQKNTQDINAEMPPESPFKYFY